LSTTSGWRHNFSAIWTRSIVWMCSHRNSRARTTRLAQRLFKRRLLQQCIALPMHELLAFADHAAEFYAGSGNNFRRALELAGANVANRPTRLAVKQVQTLALNVDEGARN
jgi:hypothetical protein